MEDRLPRKLAAILYADVADYSRLTGEDEDATHRALSQYLDLIASTIESHRGQVMHYAGDAVLAKFDAVVDALSSAVTIQNKINTGNQKVPDDRKVQFRIGVNLGDVIEDRGDIYGDGVNVAARLESLAKPGGICISESVRLALGNKFPLEFECMGEQEVKNIAEPVMAYRAAIQDSAIHAGAQHKQTVAELPEKPSIAVLPFVNMSGDSEQEYFSDGMTEDIITGLSRFRELVVISRGSTFALKDQSLDSAESAKKLGVRYLLEGSVRKAGGRARITAQLIEGATGTHLWAETYDRSLEDVFAVQDDVTQTIVSTLAGRLEVASRKRASRKGPTNLSAYDHLLRGKYRFNDGYCSKDDVLKSRAAFEQAIELDPDYASAHLCLAETFNAEYKSDWSTAPDVAAECALEFARRAAELDELASEPHLMLAWLYFSVKSNFELAEVQARRALELNPNNYWNYCFKAEFSMCSGDFQEGISCANEAIRRNPFLPYACLWSKGFAEYFAEQYDNAITTFARMSVPRVDVQACIAACYAQLGRDDAARAAAAEFRHRAKKELDSLFQNSESWRAYWSSKLHFKDPAQLEHLVDGLRLAGLSD
jgi:adenylate cyclase